MLLLISLFLLLYERQPDGKLLLIEPSHDGLYIFPSMLLLSSSHSSHIDERTTLNQWHRKLGHPSLALRPLELPCANHWGPAPYVSRNGYKYYISFVDHFTHFMWFFCLKFKSDVIHVFSTLILS